MPAITTNPQVLLASNTSAVYIQTQDEMGVAVTPDDIAETSAVRIVGAPKFTPRGAGLIQRTDILTPWGGGQAVRTGGLGWDISFSTEFFWKFDGAEYSVDFDYTKTQLAALWKASPWQIFDGSADPVVTVNTGFMVQPYFAAGTFRGSNGEEPEIINPDYTAQPFTIYYVETSGKRFAAYDCLCVPKISWEYGQRAMIEWTIKGKWIDVDAFDTPDEIVAPVYVDPADQAPLIGANCNVTLTDFFENINAVSKVAIDTGWQLNDVGDTRETFGMGIAFINLATYPTITLTVADLAEGVSRVEVDPPTDPVTYTNTGREPDWTDAQSNFINPNQLTLTLGVGTSSIVWQLANPQLIAWPTPGDENGYRNNSLTFGGVPSSSNQTVMAMTFVDATEAP